MGKAFAPSRRLTFASLVYLCLFLSTRQTAINMSSSGGRFVASVLATLILALLLLLPAGTHAGIVWSDFVGGSFGDSFPKPRGIAANGAGYSCIGGRWNRNAAAFSIGPYVFPQVAGAGPYGGPYGGFVALRDPKGRLLWARSFGSNTDHTVYNVAIDKAGNCYVAGTFLSETLTVGDPGGKHFVLHNIEPYNGTQISAFFTKLRRGDGSPQWATNLKVPGTGIPHTLMVKGRSLYVVGYVNRLDPASVVNGRYQVNGFALPACNGPYCMLLGKYSSVGKGTWEWVQSYGGTSGSVLLLWAGLSPNGHRLYVAGDSNAQGIKFGASVVNQTNVNFVGVVDAKTGAALEAMALLGTEPVIVSTLTIDSHSGALYLAGRFGQNVTLGNNAAGQPVSLSMPSAGNHAYVVKYSGDATRKQRWNTVLWAQAFATATGNVDVRDLVVGPPKGALSLSATYNGQQLHLGNGFVFTNPGFNSTAPASSYYSNVITRLDGATGKVVAASDQVGGPERTATYWNMPTFLGADKTGHLYLFGSSAITYTDANGVAPIPYNQSTMATCGLPVSALAPNSPNLYWAKVSTLDCNGKDRVKCSSATGCFVKRP